MPIRTLAVKLVVLECALVLGSVRELLQALTRPDAVPEVPLVLGTVRVPEDPSPVLPALYEIALVAVSVRVRERPSAVHDATAYLANVVAPVRKADFTLALGRGGDRRGWRRGWRLDSFGCFLSVRRRCAPGTEDNA